MIGRARATAYALGWAGAIVGTEWFCRRGLRSRSTAWLVSYATLGAIAWASGSRLRQRSRSLSLRGLTVAAIGYPLGRRLLGDRTTAAPPDGLLHELAAIEVVAVVEELTWGSIVEPILGARPTAALFAVKHALIDRRWRRTLGLFLFWRGLSRQRRRWAAAALAWHCALNAIGIIRGHQANRDQF